MTLFPCKHGWENNLALFIPMKHVLFSWRNVMAGSFILNMLTKVPDIAELFRFHTDKYVKIRHLPFHWARPGNRTNTMQKCPVNIKLNFLLFFLTIKCGLKNRTLIPELQVQHPSHSECEDQHNIWLPYFRSCSKHFAECFELFFFFFWFWTQFQHDLFTV